MLYTWFTKFINNKTKLNQSSNFTGHFFLLCRSKPLFYPFLDYLWKLYNKSSLGLFNWNYFNDQVMTLNFFYIYLTTFHVMCHTGHWIILFLHVCNVPVCGRFLWLLSDYWLRNISHWQSMHNQKVIKVK